ncbi:F-box/LRR-repeat protein 20 [Acropora cervicornis]|uniref:F-box/LRR-repeat protein 20 n=1 Tax=Acropora cervicornis TaxID=6130 RepID=A0AAD9VD48_ACRCE|nr:F-box/LRR-repeat protein 20 [Acropora cervicornis]
MCSNHTNHTSYNHHHSRANSRSRFEVSVLIFSSAGCVIVHEERLIQTKENYCLSSLYNFNTNEDQALINKKLPKELILRIFSFLDVVTLCRCAQVSKEIVVLNLSRRCVGFLKSLSLKGCKSVGDTALRIFAQQCKNIEELCLEGCKRISDSKGCTKLEYLNVSWCTQISSQGLKLLAQGCQNLLAFIAEGCSLITDEGIYHLTKSCVRLRTIKLKTCENIKDGAIKAISEHCRDITLLCVSGCIQLTDLSLQHLGNNSHELRTLEAAQCSQFTDAGFQALCRITDSTLNHLSLWCSGLQKLSLSHCELITDEGIRHFCGSPCAIDHIEELELDNCPLITDNALDYLINCHQLKRVELFDCQLITKAGTRRLRAHLPDLRVHEYFAPVTPPPSVGGGRQRMCRCCVML